MTDSDPIGNIYITAKARMAAEARLRRNDILSQVAVGWYSVCIIAISLLDLSQHYRVSDVSVMTAILSIVVLATSVFLPGQSFAVRAAGYRECYLRLQQIYWSAESADAKLKIYAETLPLYENHLQADYEHILFRSWLYGKPLKDKEGKLVVTKAVICKGFLRWAVGGGVLVILFIAPIVFGLLLTTSKGV